MNYSREFANDPSVLESSVMGGYLHEMLGLDSEDPPPPGALIPITPELIRKQRQTERTAVPEEVASLFATPSAYKIGPGDGLSITVWGHPELNSPGSGSGAATGSSGAGGAGYLVDSEGQIQFAQIGLVRVRGLTELQAREKIIGLLAREIRNPQVTLRIQSYRAERVYVDGEVRAPGLLSLDDLPPTLPEVLARAGGFTAQADRSRILITRDGRMVTVNLAQLTRLGINPARILLAPDDMVRVYGREDAKVFVLGEVSRPSTQTLRDGRLTLNEALGEAGGVNPGTANPRQIYVIRATNPERPEIFHLNAARPAALALAESFELRVRDVVYVDPMPLVRWNRVISLILPSAQALTVSNAVTNTGR